jgi:ketosteroid isomerase-like protein
MNCNLTLFSAASGYLGRKYVTTRNDRDLATAFCCARHCKLEDDMKNSLKLSIFSGFAVLSLAASPAIAGDNPKVAAEVMALARAQWDAEIAGKPVADQIVSLADDYTEFSAGTPIRIDGKSMNARFYQAGELGGTKPVASDMVNPKVQVYGDTAILTYNFVGLNQSKDGKVENNNAVSTRVYSLINGKWMLVHGHFTVVK